MLLSKHTVDMVQYLLGSRVDPYLHLAKQLNHSGMENYDGIVG